MRVIRGLQMVRPRRPLCLAMGVFDGVHLGHQAIVSTAVKMAAASGRRAAPAVLTFDPHPDAILSPQGAPPLLTTTDEKLDLLGSFGVKLTIIVEFTRAFADTPADAFIAEVLARRVRAWCAVVGEGWRFGAGGRGNLRLLREMGAELGFHVRVVPRVKRAGHLVSSTRIRTLLAHGHVSAAHRLLGYPYGVRGEVVPGEGRGRQLGFPTANLRLPSEKLIPADGVYACLAGVRSMHPAVASVGVRPTFERAGARRVEVHMLGRSLAPAQHSPELVGRLLRVHFIARLRGERKFSSPDALARQMAIDCRHARKALSR